MYYKGRGVLDTREVGRCIFQDTRHSRGSQGPIFDISFQEKRLRRPSRNFSLSFRVGEAILRISSWMKQFDRFNPDRRKDCPKTTGRVIWVRLEPERERRPKRENQVVGLRSHWRGDVGIDDRCFPSGTRRRRQPAGACHQGKLASFSPSGQGSVTGRRQRHFEGQAGENLSQQPWRQKFPPVRVRRANDARTVAKISRR